MFSHETSQSVPLCDTDGHLGEIANSLSPSLVLPFAGPYIFAVVMSADSTFSSSMVALSDSTALSDSSKRWSTSTFSHSGVFESG